MLSEWIEGWRNRVDVTAPPPGGWASSIERRNALSVEEFVARYMIPRQPVIITDAAKHWQALRWTPDSLRTRLGRRPVPVGGKISKVEDVWTPREDQFPLLKDARPLHLVMRPGETLFVPAGWWHSTRLGDASISVGESCVNSSNWLHFVRDAAEMASRPLKVKGALVATFLLGAGAVMGVGERLLRRQAGTPEA